MNIKSVFIGGNGYGYGNIGDDAILEGILLLFKEGLPDVGLSVETAGGDRLGFIPEDVAVTDHADTARVRQAIHGTDCFISGGGTMIGDELGPGFPLMYNASRIATAKHLAKGAVMLAIGANQLHTAKGTEIARLLATHTDVITVRDQESLDVCLALGADARNVHLTADPAFLLSPNETYRTRQLKARIKARGKTIGVNVVNEAWRDLKDYKSAIAQACDTLSTQYGCFPIFFCNEVRDGSRYDYEANMATASMLHCGYESLEPVYYTPREMIDIMSAFDGVVSMRMHSLIFAALAETPFVAVSRVDKVDNFMRLLTDYGASGSVENCNGETLAADAASVMRHWPVLKRDILRQITMLQNRCRHNIDILRGLLQQRKTFHSKSSLASLQYVISPSRDGRIKRNLRYLLSGQLTIQDAIRKLLGRPGGKREEREARR